MASTWSPSWRAPHLKENYYIKHKIQLFVLEFVCGLFVRLFFLFVCFLLLFVLHVTANFPEDGRDANRKFNYALPVSILPCSSLGAALEIKEETVTLSEINS